MDFNKMNDDWKGEAPKLASMEKRNPFLVPETYFDTLSEQIQSRIAIEQFLNNQDSGFIVPEAYFESLPDQIESRIFVEDLQQTASKPGFTVPEGYFDKLQEQITARIDTENEVKIVPIRKRRISSWISYAAAACVTLAISTGIYINYENNKIENQLSTISETEIVNYLQLHSDNADTQIIYENMPSDATLAPVDDFSSTEIQQYQEYLNSTLN